MSKNSKNWAQEMLNASKSPEGKKEVINACLYVLKYMSEHAGPVTAQDIQKISGGGGPTDTTSTDVTSKRLGSC